MYEIRFTEAAKGQLKKLEKDVQRRITGALERIRFSPEKHVNKLVGSSAYSLRVGDYRVIMDIERGILLILALKVGHRRGTYQRI